MTVPLPRHSPGQCGDLIVPSLANAVALGVGHADAAGTWAQMTSGLGVGFVLMGVYAHVRVAASATFLDVAQLEVGIGTTGNEVPVAGFGFDIAGIFTTSGQGCGYGKPLRCAPVLIPAGTRITARVSHAAGTGLVVTAYLFGVDAALWELVCRGYGDRDARRYRKGTLAAQGATYFSPVRARHTVTTGSPAWTPGAWVTAIASVAKPAWVTALHALNKGTASLQNFQFDIGIGASPLAAGKCGLPSIQNSFLHAGSTELVRPVLALPGQQLSIRSAGNLTNRALDVFLVMEEFD
ncbi:MAG: hypothetical protein WEC75_03120 [Dehalococcoidia bacterium]